MYFLIAQLCTISTTLAFSDTLAGASDVTLRGLTLCPCPLVAARA